MKDIMYLLIYFSCVIGFAFFMWIMDLLFGRFFVGGTSTKSSTQADSTLVRDIENINRIANLNRSESLIRGNISRSVDPK